MKRKRRAQSTMEYTLLFAGITLAILYGISQVITPSVERQADAGGEVIDTATGRLQHALGVGAGGGEVE